MFLNFLPLYTQEHLQKWSSYINSNSLCIIPMEISALVWGTAWYRWRRAEHRLLTLELVYAFTALPICTLQLAGHSDLICDDFKSKAREVAMKWILTVAGVSPLVRIFRKVFGGEGGCWLLCLKQRKGKKHVLVTCKNSVGTDFGATRPHH